MRGELTTKVAEWVMAREHGATILQIAVEFQLTEQRAREAVLRVRRNPKRYTYLWTGHSGRLGRDELEPKLYVRGITHHKGGGGSQKGRHGQPYRATPAPGTEHPRHPPLYFPSLTAMNAAGYPRSSVWRAINEGRPYAGYIWERVIKEKA